MDGLMDGGTDLYHRFIFSGVPVFQDFSCCNSSCISFCIDVPIGETVTFNISIQYQDGGADDDNNILVKTLRLENEEGRVLANCGLTACESQKDNVIHSNFTTDSVYNVTFEITNATTNDTGVYSMIAAATFSTSVSYTVTKFVTVSVTLYNTPGVSIIMSVQCACLCQ